eukprot:1195679-Prorocentrum_minimum.AAC.1
MSTGPIASDPSITADTRAARASPRLPHPCQGCRSNPPSSLPPLRPTCALHLPLPSLPPPPVPFQLSTCVAPAPPPAGDFPSPLSPPLLDLGSRINLPKTSWPKPLGRNLGRDLGRISEDVAAAQTSSSSLPPALTLAALRAWLRQGSEKERCLRGFWLREMTACSSSSTSNGSFT